MDTAHSFLLVQEVIIEGGPSVCLARFVYGVLRSDQCYGLNACCHPQFVCLRPDAQFDDIKR